MAKSKKKLGLPDSALRPDELIALGEHYRSLGQDELGGVLVRAGYALSAGWHSEVIIRAKYQHMVGIIDALRTAPVPEDADGLRAELKRVKAILREELTFDPQIQF